MATPFTPADVPLDAIDLSDAAFWVQPREFREGAFRTLRTQAPVHFFTEAEIPPFPKGPGYFALTRHDDVWQASRNPALFSSGSGTNIPDLPVEINEFFGSMINMDDPKHHRLRSIVSKGFTPKEIARVEEHVKNVADRLVTELLDRFPDRSCDFVEEVAAPLPLRIICEMMGIPREDEKKVFGWTNTILGAGDPEYGGAFEKLMQDSMEMFAYANALGEDRLANPREDLTSALMHAEVDGERLSPAEFGSFFILLVVAGNETTRNAISHGMRLLTLHPEQRDLWFGDFEQHTRSAVEEIVRHASPVIHFRRTVQADTEIRGVPIPAGSKVVMFYCSANRDEDAFTDPHRFDITRDGSKQLGFGAGGPHFCLGANLARREITVMFDEIRRRLPELRITGEPAYLESNFINGIKHLDCSW
jgi:cytochrome P450